jgi:hypothetical protein
VQTNQVGEIKDLFAIPSHISITCGPLEELEVYSWKKRKNSTSSTNSIKDSSMMRTLIDIEEEEEELPLEDTNEADELEIGDDGSATEDDISSDDDDDDDDDEWEEWTNDAIERFENNEPVSKSSDSESSSTTDSGKLNCHLCNNSRELSSRAKQFVTGCSNCDCSGHFACFAEKLLLKNVATPPNNQPSSSSQRLFSSIPNNTRLLPSLTNRLPCPKCSTPIQLPQLLEKSRRMHSLHATGNDTFYSYTNWSMHDLLRKYSSKPTELESAQSDTDLSNESTRKRVKY